jgi:hypothetical protein
MRRNCHFQRDLDLGSAQDAASERAFGFGKPPLEPAQCLLAYA